MLDFDGQAGSIFPAFPQFCDDFAMVWAVRQHSGQVVAVHAGIRMQGLEWKEDDAQVSSIILLP